MNAAIKLSFPLTKGFWEIPVLFEDEHLLALDKPAGLLTAANPDDPTQPGLMTLLHEGIAAGKPWARERNLEYLNNAHRLEIGTTGVLLLAKNKAAHIALGNVFSRENSGKKFIALVRGNPAEATFEVDEPTAPHPLKPGLMRVDRENGKKARTRFTVIENFPRYDYALLQCEPFIERAHQISVHLRHADMPMVGDEAYGGKNLWLSRLKQDYRLKPGREERPLIARAALHSSELTIPHPVTNETVTIQSEWPKDLKVAVKYLRQFA
jgi:RluA family pseudouridine synthase